MWDVVFSGGKLLDFLSSWSRIALIHARFVVDTLQVRRRLVNHGSRSLAYTGETILKVSSSKTVTPGRVAWESRFQWSIIHPWIIQELI